MMLPTHVVVGLTISSLFIIPVSWVIVGSIIPDFDYLLGLEHRTLMHSLLFSGSALIVYKFFGKHSGLAYFLGLSSHLIFDLTTPMGVQLLYPLQRFFSFNLFSAMDYLPNLSITLACVVLLINRESIKELLLNLRKGVLLKSTALFVSAFFITAIFFPVSDCSNNKSISDLTYLFSETEVTITGLICSEIELRTSKAGNNYQVFSLCEGNSSIIVWKGDWILENNLSINDLISVCGLYTTIYKEPELYYIKQVVKV